jgi:uncharacterized protein YcnI
MSTNRFMRRAGVVITVAGFAVLAGGGIASAHVTVSGEKPVQGGFTKITFRVPTEDETAGTVKFAIKFPDDHPVASLNTKAVPGWTVAVTKTKLATPVKTDDAEISEAVSTVTWTANQGVRIGPGEFGEFEVSGGPLPDNTDKLIIPAVQTYDNGKVVSWIDQPPAAGGAEPEHPAPVLSLGPKGSDDNDHVTASANQPVTNTASTTSTSGTDDTARWLGGIGLVVGALGLGLGAGATLRARRVVAATKADDKS